MFKQRLELDWVGKNEEASLEPSILISDHELSVNSNASENLLIYGDNLLALKALESEYSSKIRCIYIDPPYNTGQAFEHYDDGLEHSLWLSLMRDRLKILRKLLAENGAIFVQLDDNEVAYCRVLMDEIFGRNNFINQVSIKTKHTAGASGGGEDKRLKKNVEYLLIYVKNNSSTFGFNKFNDVFDEIDLFRHIKEMEEDEKSWKYTSILINKGEKIEERVVLDGSGQEIMVSKYKGIKRTTVKKLVSAGVDEKSVYMENFDRIFSDTNAQTSIRTRIIDEFKKLADDELLEAVYVPRSGRDKGQEVSHYYLSPTIRRVIWLKDSAEKIGGRIIKKEKLGTYWDGFNWNNVTKEGQVQFPNGKKPESLIARIIELSTNEGDLVLDSFAGSGTTGAVAHKMKRRWIMVELRNHCESMIVPRLRRVITGEDQNGVSLQYRWSGGGGFTFKRLAPSLLLKDVRGNWVISPKYDAAMLAHAVCKHEGFKFWPDSKAYWKQGHSSEKDFIFVTTEFLTAERLDKIASQLKQDESLLICAKAFKIAKNRYSNITIKKIPQMLLGRCEFGNGR